MAGATQRTEQRKRNRKRKRRNVSLSSSSESSDSSDSSSDEQVVKLPATKSSAKAPPPRKPSPASSSSSEEEDTSSDSDDEPNSQRKLSSITPQPPEPSRAQDNTLPPKDRNANPRTRPPSPPPLRNVPAPQLIPPGDAAGNLSSADAEKERELKDKFRKFWMSSIADAFSDDLNEIRKEPNLNQSRLALLIDSLAAGADLYSTSREMGNSRVNEIGIILGDKTSS